MTSLARAIAERCWMERGDIDLGGHWAAALDAYAGQDPQRQQDLAELAHLDDNGGRAAVSATRCTAPCRAPRT